MLSTRFFPKDVRIQITLPCQWLSITINTLRLKSDSSSRSSSFGEDNNKQKSKEVDSSKRNVENNDQFNDLINSLLNKRSSQGRDIGVSVRDREKKIEVQLMKVAETLTTAVGGNKVEILSTLLNNLAEMEKDTEKKKLPRLSPMLSPNIAACFKENLKKKQELDKKAKIDSTYQTVSAIQNTRKVIENRYNLNEAEKIKGTYKTKETKKIKETLNAMPIKQVKSEQGESVSQTLLNMYKTSKMRRYNKVEKNYPRIFNETQVSPSNVPELKTWNECEETECKYLVTHHPNSAFQEMIQWTEEGKIWKFPIDNEQGMEEEQNVHFSEHVFLDRHLTGWCPAKGPIRHFMELVCVGLSKNPYLTVQEKYGHIMWYKDYFADKKDLLKNLGLSDSTSSSTQEQLEPQ